MLKIRTGFEVIFGIFLKFFRKIIGRKFQNVGPSTRIEIRDESSNFTGSCLKNSIFFGELKIPRMVKIWAKNKGRDHQLRYYQYQ